MACDTPRILAGLLLILVVTILWGDGLSPAGEEISITDTTGQKLVFKCPPQRIISLNPDFTGNIIALGAGKRLVGITDYCRYPDGFTGSERIGNLWQPNLERIVALQPDLVLATREGNNPGIISTLRDLDIPVYVAGQSTGFKDYFELLRRLGYILGREKEAGTLIDEFTARIDRLRGAASGQPSVSVFLQVGVKPLVTINKDTLIGEMIEICGGRNVAAGLSSRYPSISREQVLADDPEVIIIAAMGNEAEEGVAFWNDFPELQAVRNARVFVLDPDTICRLGPRLMEGLSKIEAFIREARGRGTKGREDEGRRDERTRDEGTRG